MTQAALVFEEHDRIGKVASVDTSRVAIDVDNPTMLTRVGVGNLLARKGATEREYLIGITSRVKRALRDEVLEHEDEIQDELELGSIFLMIF
jgi:hypothetical protein